MELFWDTVEKWNKNLKSLTKSSTMINKWVITSYKIYNSRLKKCPIIAFQRFIRLHKNLNKITSLSSMATSAGGGLKEASISSKSKRVVRWGSCRSKSIGMLSFWGGGKQDAGSWTPSPFRSLLGAPKDTNTIWKQQMRIYFFKKGEKDTLPALSTPRSTFVCHFLRRWQHPQA